ncbi:hypothetical protein AC578_5108 [Pseudocercospora eumusae]|uniref:Large ribosomal subunit protein bL21m n=1 Tax=Pseudocercospora eumusae TaxID=321146 RepID=A0A139GY76_9PEZI|nr:hypothetical protein AC578_5108 [Pseudocercospora eumusae]
MLSRTIWRTLLESRSQLPPTFLLPWTAKLSTVSHTTDAPSEPPPTTQGSTSSAPIQTLQASRKASNVSKSSPLILSRSVRHLLPVLQAQSPHYITAHIHGFPYLLTEGDTLRLPFLMHGVEPGDVIRLNRAINLGSRDLTLKAPAPGDKIKSPVTSSRHVIDPTTGTMTTHSNVVPEGATAPHFIPHIAKGKHSYIDDRLFVCRAVVMGVESEPLRIKEKTKRRQRHVRKVKSKHRYTILKIKELRLKLVQIQAAFTVTPPSSFGRSSIVRALSRTVLEDIGTFHAVNVSEDHVQDHSRSPKSRLQPLPTTDAHQATPGPATLTNGLRNHASIQSGSLNDVFQSLTPSYPAPTIRKRAQTSQRVSVPSTNDLDNWTLACNIQRELASMRENFSSLQATIDGFNAESSIDINAIREIDGSIKSLEQLYMSIVSSIPVHARPTTKSAAKAHKLFDIAELLEKVLLNLDFASMIRVQQAHSVFRNAFKQSARLQQVTGLRPSSEGPTYSPLANLFFISRGCLVRFQHTSRRGTRPLADDEVFISATFSSVDPFDSRELPTVGPMLQKSLVCQPPLTTMTIRTSCCHDPIQHRSTTARLQSTIKETPQLYVKTGITLGIILEQTKKLRDAHRLCPNADIGQHRDDGTVDVQVYFEAIRKLSPGDPILVERRRAREEYVRSREETACREEEMSAYIEAKQTARDSDLPVPTLQQFRDKVEREAANHTKDSHASW